METPLVSLEDQHQTDTTIPAHALAGPTLTVQASMEKVSDLSITLPNSSFTSDSVTEPVPRFRAQTAVTQIQSIVPELASANVFSQADHSPPLPQSTAQVAAAPAPPPAARPRQTHTML